ncbi:putative pentatricopeptide repeat-containing protein At1g19290 [Glycine soja]|uniref:putative pentatricopeptide repeat-containing protein At1g19290 n=1 Tax=Glycine soja TaxID=3848 RepID=UPI00103FFC30|nr:putative pentatricopeptide repeat-containing protein At1g19290 [Glycine soja]
MGDYRAKKLWKEILGRGFSKSTVAFNTMIGGLGKMGKVVEAQAVFDRMKELGCSPDEITYRTLSDGYCKIVCVVEAFRIKDTMERQTMSPSIEMYNSLINGLFKSRKSSDVANLLVEMQRRGLSPKAVVIIMVGTRAGRIHRRPPPSAAVRAAVRRRPPPSAGRFNRRLQGFVRLEERNSAQLTAGPGASPRAVTHHLRARQTPARDHHAPPSPCRKRARLLPAVSSGSPESVSAISFWFRHFVE